MCTREPCFSSPCHCFPHISGHILSLSVLCLTQVVEGGAVFFRKDSCARSCLFQHMLCLLCLPNVVQVVEGGVVFFRESCFRQSGDKARKNNPTHYRCDLRAVPAVRCACRACYGVFAALRCAVPRRADEARRTAARATRVLRHAVLCNC